MKRQSAPGLLLLYLVLVSAPLVAQFLLLTRLEIKITAYDFRGLISNLWVPMVMMIPFLYLKGRAVYVFFIPMAIIWGGLHQSNIEAVHALGDTVDLSFIKYLGDATFFKGTALKMQHPWYMAFFLSLPLWVFFVFIPKPVTSKERKIWVGITVAMSLLQLVPSKHELPNWRQRNALVENVIILWVSNTQNTDASPQDYIILADEKLNLDGVPRYKSSKKNVILIMLEAVSQAYLDSPSLLRSKHVIHMPQLEKLATDNIHLKNMISHNRQTNRGEYAMLCGDYPNLVNKYAKMDDFAHRNKREQRVCLPQALANNGYETVYLQAAPINFMSKDVFMAAAGFDQVYGFSWFEGRESDSSWGVDDGEFFLQSRKMVEQLAHEDKPFFLTLLTVGTHHPYPLPKKYRNSKGNGTFSGAQAYLDQVIAEFIDYLDEASVLDDTLVLITADESAGIHPANSIERFLVQNWIPMIVIDKGADPLVIEEPYAQVDVTGSILDYLDAVPENHMIKGRSLFRSYSSPRDMYFGNTFYQNIYQWSSDRVLTSCKLGFRNCVQYDLPGLSGPARSISADPSRATEKLSHFVGAVDIQPDHDVGNRTVQLIQPGSKIKLNSKNVKQNVFGFKYFDLPVDTIATVDVKLKVEDAGVRIFHDILGERGKAKLYIAPRPQLLPGMEFNFSYDYLTRKGWKGFETRLYAYNNSGETANLTVEKATLSWGPRWIPWGDEGDTNHRVQVASKNRIFDLLTSKFVNRAECLKVVPLGLKWDGCDRTLLFTGPKLPATRGTPFESVVEIEVLAGEIEAWFDIGDKGRTQKLEESRRWRLSKGTHTISHEYIVDRRHRFLVESGLRIVGKTKSPSFILKSGRLSVGYE